MVSSEALRSRVCEAYSGAARRPEATHPFPVGRAFAESVGFSAELLDTVPEACANAFAGVSCVSLIAELPPGAVVLDLGCGAGLDSLVAAWRVGASGRVVGVDFSASMLDRARHAAVEKVFFVQAAAESLPLASESVDAAMVNGIFNLNPFRDAIFSELARVVRPGGRVWAAELVLRAALTEELRAGDANWFS